MSLGVGARLGHYDVTALIGEGGMGQVYRATDTKLKRQVALKILPEAFATDPDRLARFQREAEVLASLNHPNMAQIHGLEEADGVRALVLELVEGPTLADRIKQGPIPLDEALPIAKQIAEALEAAHEQGVIHRDLKPANIKVREDGTVKVLDFGLAKALDPSPTGDPSQSPTLTAAATQMGVIMGTAAYMSPEQAAGQTADKRSDLWSFGVVLYEMLTGQRLFTGKTISHVLAKVLEREIDFGALPTTTPAPLRRLLRRCLDKDQKHRLRDATEVVVHLEEAATAPVEDSSVGATVAPNSQPVGWRQALPWVAGLTLAAITGFAVWGLMRPTAPQVALPARSVILAPQGVQPFEPMVSPDGRTVVFEGAGTDQSQIYIRSLDQLEAVPLSGTENAIPESFSPDGQWLLITEFGAVPWLLKRVPLAGGPAVTVRETPNIMGATWGPDDTLILGSREGLWSMPVSGERTQLTTLGEGEVGHMLPRFLPSGRAVVFYVRTRQLGEEQVAVYDFDTGQHRTLVTGASPQFATSGHLVFWRQDSLWAVPFDPDQLEVMGDPLPVVADVLANSSGWAQYDTTSSDGTLLYVSSSNVVFPRANLVWVDREGSEEPVAAEPRFYRSVRLSPEGRWIATVVQNPGAGTDVFIYDLERGALTPLTSPWVSHRLWR